MQGFDCCGFVGWVGLRFGAGWGEWLVAAGVDALQIDEVVGPRPVARLLAAQVGEPERLATVAPVGGADQREQCLIRIDREE